MTTFIPSRDANLPKWQADVARVVNGLNSTVSEIFVNVKSFGAKADGTDAAPAIQAAANYAMANKFTLLIPGGDYSIGSTITFGTNGFHVIGDGWENSRLIPTAAVPAILVTGQFGKMEDIGVWGTSAGTGTGVGTYGLICKNAGSSEFIGCHFRNMVNDGVFIDTDYGGGTGNNNLMKFRGGGADTNGGCGVRFAQRPDNNGCSFMGFETNGNTSHGILLKSEGHYVDPACIQEGNGGYGIQTGEDADTSSNVNSLILCPWTESNTLGAYRGSATSGSNRYIIKSSGSVYTRAAGAVDSVEYISAGLDRFGSNDGDYSLQASASANQAFLLAASRTGGNVNLRIGGGGSGVIHAQSDVHLDNSKLFDGATGLQIVGARNTGWTADTGTAEKTAHATYTGGTANATYLQAEITAIRNALQDVSRGQKALKDALIAHGLIGA